jgi:hypothetical protein
VDATNRRSREGNAIRTHFVPTPGRRPFASASLGGFLRAIGISISFKPAADFLTASSEPWFETPHPDAPSRSALTIVFTILGQWRRPRMMPTKNAITNECIGAARVH